MYALLNIQSGGPYILLFKNKENCKKRFKELCEEVISSMGKEEFKKRLDVGNCFQDETRLWADSYECEELLIEIVETEVEDV